MNDFDQALTMAKGLSPMGLHGAAHSFRILGRYDLRLKFDTYTLAAIDKCLVVVTDQAMDERDMECWNALIDKSPAPCVPADISWKIDSEGDVLLLNHGKREAIVYWKT